MVTGRYRPHAALAALLLTIAAGSHATAIERLATYRDAFVEFNALAGEWTIGNDQVRFTVRGRRDGTVALVGLDRTGSGSPITVGNQPDALVTLEGATSRLGETDSTFLVQRIDGSTGTHFVSLAIRFLSSSNGLVATRHYVVYAEVPVVEMWTTFETNDGSARTVENLNAYSLDLLPGTIESVSGLDTSESEGGAFTRRTRRLSVGERMALGSPTLSTEADTPFFSIGNGDERAFSGLLWSGAWSASIVREEAVVHVELGLPPMSATARADQPVEGPHAFVGAVVDRAGADTAAVTAFVRAGRAGRPLPALTTFNTWFVHGIGVDERLVERDIELAASVGIEQLQLDAGWYPRDGAASIFDFSNGLGTWEVDADRFPSGLRALTDYAHERGLKFGLWVEPERVWLDTVGRPGLAEEPFLAQQDGAYQPGTPNDEVHDAQVCLADPRARAWVMERLTRLIDDVQPDNLKWDVNRWITCNRPGHGHPVDGGNYAHTQALYEILAMLRQRYPDLTIENCSGGGHRLDFAMARLTDSAWMDDRSSPSSHVRRNLQGLFTIFPAEYLFSYVMPHPDEAVRGADDIPLLVRSRMPGMVGLAAELSDLGEREINELYQQFTLVKSLRESQATAVTYTLTPQRAQQGDWEVIQQVLPASGVSYIFAFSQGASDTTIVSLHDIQSDRIYEVRSAERGTIGRVRGADLIAQGFEIARAPESAAQVLVLEPVGVDGERAAASVSLGTPAPRQSNATRRAATPGKRLN